KLADRVGELAQMQVAILSSVPPESALFARLKSAPPPVASIPTLPKPSTADRAKVIASYGAVGAMQGSPQRGHTLFLQQCAICHPLKGDGKEVGPDLGMVSDKPLDWLITALFDPNAAIEPRYQAQLVKLKTGGELSGLVSGETANNLTLRLPGGSEYPVLRSDLAAQSPLGRSLMPEGLETVLKPQDVADLIAWLRAK
ncbi:MAG: c-type cytochrome, partial [Chthoniobacteraceae bacterium]